ncbi:MULTISPECIES: histidine phosphatase family protein [Nocardioides]|uniref:histidine phosphatase family protein n=1 Tax=Nocardioides TaxID=1839 RepID=UPI0003301BD2|nr:MULTISPECIES: histidine phosphatase family protein [Nocardioides]EON24465.1 phosphoglycerate mutase [Nocardioides sp. CF8]
MSKPRTLVLLRHGQTSWNAEQRAQGHTDVELDAVGRAQAAAVASAIAALRPAALWSSDLLRASATADEVARATGLTVRLDKRLREYDVGERSGLTMAEFAAAFPSEHAAWMAAGGAFEGADLVPGAESTHDVQARIVPALREALASVEPGETVCVVGHGAATKVGLGGLLGWDAATRQSLRGLDNCGWATLVETGVQDGLRLTAYNRVAPDFTSAGSVG